MSGTARFDLLGFSRYVCIFSWVRVPWRTMATARRELAFLYTSFYTRSDPPRPTTHKHKPLCMDGPRDLL